MHALLVALGWKNKKILAPAYTCAVIPQAIVASGNTPVFADSAPDHFNVSPHTLNAAMHETINMVIPTPIFGYPIDRTGYSKVIKDKAPESFILFDAAHGFLVEDDRGVQFSDADAVLFGLGPGKQISTLNGGMLLLRDKAIGQAVEEVRKKLCFSQNGAASFGKTLYGTALYAAFRYPLLNLTHWMEQQTTFLHRFTDKYYGTLPTGIPDECYAYPFPFQAELGSIQLPMLDRFTQMRRELAALYEERLGREGFSLFAHQGNPTWSHFPLLVRQRDTVLTLLQKRNVQCGKLIDYSCADLPEYDQQTGDFPNATRFGAGMINLPIWPGLDSVAFEHVISALLYTREATPEAF